MNRRELIKSLAALPFIGVWIARAEPVPAAVEATLGHPIRVASISEELYVDSEAFNKVYSHCQYQMGIKIAQEDEMFQFYMDMANTVGTSLRKQEELEVLEVLEVLDIFNHV